MFPDRATVSKTAEFHVLFCPYVGHRCTVCDYNQWLICQKGLREMSEDDAAPGGLPTARKPSQPNRSAK